MIENNYFIVPYPVSKAILPFIIEKKMFRMSKDRKTCIVKTYVGAKVPNILKQMKKYNHFEIYAELKKAEWKFEDINLDKI